MQKKKKFKEEKKQIFVRFSFLFMASVRSRPPGPPLVPGVLIFTYRVQVLKHFIIECLTGLTALS